VKPLTEQQIRASFVNCSRGEAKRLPVPRELADVPWEHLDFLGWHDLGAPDRTYLVAEREGDPVGITLRFASQQRGYRHRSMCALCLTTHPGDGVSLMAAAKTGAAGRQGNTVGTYICTDLACSLYVRGRKPVAPGGRMEESLTLDEQIARTRTNLFAFIDRLSA
jgi:hypothetical protein